MAWSGTGSVNAFGGTWNDTLKIFTVMAATEQAAGVPGAVVAGERLLVTDAGSGGQLSACFGDVAAGTTFSAAPFSGDDLGGLALVTDDAILTAWNFTTNLTGGSVLLSFNIGPGATNLEVWHFDGTSWMPYAASDLIYDSDGIASFTVSGFSGYAVTGIPEPAVVSLLALGSLAFLRRNRSCR